MSLFKQSAALAGARLADKLASLAIVLILSRRFHEEGLGEFNYYFSLVTLFSPLIDMGISMTLLQRWHERDHLGQRRLLTQLTILKLSVGFAALAGALAADAINHWGHTNSLAVCAAFATLFFDDIADFLRRPAQANGIMWPEAVIPLFGRGLQLAGLLILMDRLTDGYQVIYIYAAANTIEVLVSIYGIKGYPLASLKNVPGEWWSILKNGAPFAMSGFFVMATLNLDVVLLNHFRGDREVGIYTAATRILMVLNVVNGAICHALFPKLLKAKSERNPQHAGWLLNGTLRGFLILFGGISIGGAFVGTHLMIALYGQNFADSGPIFSLLSPLVLLSALYSLLGQSLEILGQQRKVMLIYGLSAVLNIIGNVALIPHFGMYGSAAATLASSLVMTIMIFAALFKNEHLTMSLGGTGRAVVFLAIIAVCYIPLSWWNAYIALPAGALIFAVLLLPFRGFWFKGMGRLAGRTAKSG